MKRRTFIAGAGGIAATAIGTYSLTNPVAANSEATITAADATVESDDGTVSRVTILPEITVDWSGFDEEVRRIRILIDARHDGGEWHPVFRSTPWLDGSQADEEGWDHGTSGTASFGAEVFGVRGIGEDYDETDPDPIVVANEVGVPAYTDEEYVEGTNLGAHVYDHDPDAIVNHSDEQWGDSDGHRYGYYGAAANVEDFDTAEDGETATIPVTLRYTVTLHRADDFSPLAMYDEYEDELHDSENHSAESIPRSDLVKSDGHPAVVVEQAPFDVIAENVAAEGSASGTSNTNAE